MAEWMSSFSQCLGESRANRMAALSEVSVLVSCPHPGLDKNMVSIHLKLL